MALRENNKSHENYCYLCNNILTGKCNSVGIEKSEGAKCDCDIGMCTHRANCRLNPLKIAEAEMSKAIADYPDNVYAKQIWNEAIEAAALVADDGINMITQQIRNLKK